METMRDYVVRRAFEHKRYREVSEATEVGYEWLKMLSRGLIPNPGVNRMERLYKFYKLHESKRRRAA